MLEKQTFKFLYDLGENNSKEWFEDHQEAYDRAHANLIDFAGKLIGEVAKFDEDIASAKLDPAKCVPRIHHDMRFHPDRPPYKSRLVIFISAGGPRDTAGYVVQVESAHSTAGCGIYTPEPEPLNAIREAISNHYEKWAKIVDSPDISALNPKGLSSSGTLQRAPMGFDPEDPAIDYLRQKGFILDHPITNTVLESADAVGTVVGIFRTAKPLVEFLNGAIKAKR